MKTIEVRRNGQTRWIDRAECEWLLKRDMIVPVKLNQNLLYYPALGHGLHVIDHQLTIYAAEQLPKVSIVQNGVSLAVPAHMFVRLYDGGWVDLKDGKWTPNISSLGAIKHQLWLWRNDKPNTHGILRLDNLEQPPHQRLSVPQIIFLLNTKAIERGESEGYYIPASSQNFAKIQASLESAGLALAYIGVDKPGTSFSTQSNYQQVPKGAVADKVFKVVEGPVSLSGLSMDHHAVPEGEVTMTAHPGVVMADYLRSADTAVPEDGPCAIDMQLTQADFKHLYKACGAEYGQNDHAGKVLRVLGYLVQYAAGWKSCRITRYDNEIAAYYTAHNGGHFLMHAVWSGSDWGTHS